MTAEEAREATLSSANFKRKQDDVDEVWTGQDNYFCVRWCIAFDKYAKG